MSLGKQLEALTQLILDWRKIELEYVVRKLCNSKLISALHAVNPEYLMSIAAFGIFIVRLSCFQVKCLVIHQCVYLYNVINIQRQSQRLSELQAHTCHQPFTNYHT